jgi:hypothetical protein
VYRVGVDGGVCESGRVWVYVWTLARCVAMVVVSERVWCGVVLQGTEYLAGGGDAACDLSHSLAQALAQGVHSAR